MFFKKSFSMVLVTALSIILLCIFASCSGGGTGGGGGVTGGGGYNPYVSPTPTPSPTQSASPTPSPTVSPSPSVSPTPSPTVSPSLSTIYVHFTCPDGTVGQIYREGDATPFLNFSFQNNLATLYVEPGNYYIEFDYLGVTYRDPATGYFSISQGQTYDSYPQARSSPQPPPPSPSIFPSPSLSSSPSPSPSIFPSPSPSPSPSLSPTMGKIIISYVAANGTRGYINKPGYPGHFLTFEIKNNTVEVNLLPGEFQVEIGTAFDPSLDSYFSISAGQTYYSYPH